MAEPLGAKAASAAADVEIATLPPSPWQTLRAPAGDLDRIGAACGFPLPRRVGAAHLGGDGRACCLGPDEWRLLLPAAPRAALVELLADGRCSLIDVGEAELTIAICGPGALRVLAGGCPLDAARMGSGRVTRTVFGPVQIVLLAIGPEHFEVSVARSYHPYLAGLMESIAREPA